MQQRNFEDHQFAQQRAIENCQVEQQRTIERLELENFAFRVLIAVTSNNNPISNSI